MHEQLHPDGTDVIAKEPTLVGRALHDISPDASVTGEEKGMAAAPRAASDELPSGNPVRVCVSYSILR